LGDHLIITTFNEGFLEKLAEEEEFFKIFKHLQIVIKFHNYPRGKQWNEQIPFEINQESSVHHTYKVRIHNFISTSIIINQTNI
jgi:hypothetical protein